MKTNQFLFAAFVAAFLSVANYAAAQVTIGGGDPPKAGTILDLNSSSGDKGGLLLSNVSITDLNAIPYDVAADVFPGINASNHDTKKGDLAGTIVYNIKKNLEPNGGGIYIWNGSKWYYIGGGKGIATVPDHFEPSCATNSVCQKFFDEGFYPVPLSDTDRTFNVTYQSRSADFVMKPVTGGVFYMGNQTTDNSKPNYDTGSTAYSVHQVGVSSFYMSKTEVTQKQFLTVMDAAGEDNTLPITYRSWYDAIAFCNKLSLLDGKEPCYSVSTVSNWATLAYSSIPTSNTDAWNNVIWDKTANGYRLATEAEWEYAARGGQKNEYTRTLGASGTQYVFSGSNTINDVAWNVNLGGATREVATKAANDLGLHDMSGNVWEFCWDRHGDYSTCCEESPVGATSGERILRGGSYSGTLHVSARHSYSGSSYNRIYPDHGFRIVCSAF